MFLTPTLHFQMRNVVTVMPFPRFNPVITLTMGLMLQVKCQILKTWVEEQFPEFHWILGDLRRPACLIGI